MKITVLVENTAESPGLLAEHGLAFWIEAGSQCILFDTGQGNVLLNNAYRLGISLSRVDAIVLSHGHYDHTGGLADALRGNRPEAVYAHPAAMKPKFARNKDGTSREIGVPSLCEWAVQRRPSQLVLTEKPTPISNRFTATDLCRASRMSWPGLPQNCLANRLCVPGQCGRCSLGGA